MGEKQSKKNSFPDPAGLCLEDWGVAAARGIVAGQCSGVVWQPRSSLSCRGSGLVVPFHVSL